ncbi:MAG TPA: glycosyltransferase family 1 protein [Acidobacteriota bacterium]|nr:glycosyltransferase family 1 protein [Acidobacteriota bacterium]
MRVAVDARELTGRRTGVGRVIQGLLEAWPPGDELCLITRTPLPSTLLQPNWRTAVDSAYASLPGALWEHVRLPRMVRASRADALLAPNYSMPLRAPCPTAVCMHDCAPFALPHGFRTRERWRRQAAARFAARRAAFLFMGSRFAADEAQRTLAVAEERLLVIPWGLTRGFGAISSERIDDVQARYGIRGRSVLFVGSGLQRRGLRELGTWMAEIGATRPDVELLVAGTKHQPGGDTAPIRHLGYVPEDDLAPLYAAATVVAYPSSYEGFGLSVLEALACGTPAVASATSALAEVYAGRARLVPHGDGDAWKTALTALLDDATERQRTIETGTAWARAQRWEPSATQLRARLATAVGDSQ